MSTIIHVNPANLSIVIKEHEQNGWEFYKKSSMRVNGKLREVTVMSRDSSLSKTARTAFYGMTAPCIFTISLVGFVLCTAMSCWSTTGASADNETIRWANRLPLLTDNEIDEAREKTVIFAEKACELAGTSCELNDRWYDKLKPCDEKKDLLNIVANPESPNRSYSTSGNQPPVVKLQPATQPTASSPLLVKDVNEQLK